MNTQLLRNASAILCALLASIGPLQAQATNSNFTGPAKGNWSNPANWSPAVVPNNGGGMNFDVTINKRVQLDIDVTVSSFDLNSVGSRLVDNMHQFTAANTSVGKGFVELTGTGTIRLGNLADFSNKTLNSGSYTVDANMPGQIAKLQFNGADIVNNYGFIRFLGPDARMEDENGNNALAHLALNGAGGSLIRLGYGSTLSLSTDFHNAGLFILRQGSSATFNGGYTSVPGDGDDGLLEFYGTDTGARSGDGNVIVTGAFGNQDANGVLSGKFFLWNYGTAQTVLQYKNANITDVTGDVLIQGENARIVDQNGNDALRNLRANHSQNFGLQFGARTVNIAGNFDNEGILALVGDAHFEIAGNFTSNALLILDVFDLYQGVAFDGFPPSDAGVLSSDLSVMGDFTLTDENDLWSFLVTPDVIDKIVVGGTATIGGKLTLLFAFDATPDAVFTILTSAHPIAGHFSNVASGERANAYNVDPETVVPLDYPAGSFRVDYSGNNLTLSDYQRALPAELHNLSTRLRVQTGDNVGIAGFIITGTDSKQILLRAIGPSMSVNGSPVPGRLDDTVLELRDEHGALLAMNDNWTDSQQVQAIQAAGLAPTDNRESAILQTLPTGPYTAIVRGKNGTSGIGSVEVYEVGATSAAKLANLSTRGLVETGDNVLIGGLIAGTPNSGLTTLVVRAVGPSLAARGVSSALRDPVLEVHDGDGNLIASNDNWKSDQRTEIENFGLGLQDDREAALVLTAAAASRTVIVRGAGATSGVALVEIYNVGMPAQAKQQSSRAVTSSEGFRGLTSRARAVKRAQ